MLNYIYPVIIIAALICSTVAIDLKQEKAKKVGKLKHRQLVLIIQLISFIGVLTFFGNGFFTVIGALIVILFSLPLYNIPYNGKYNKVFQTGWNYYRNIQAGLVAVGLVLILVMKLFNI
ncbi:hypothetical protein NRE35_004256 [Salmonella enterica]|nr:hypothetical protein [Salmonella enterica subsp. enterica serovar Oslo]EEX4841902.1 hypothetical protein [Escherichia coli]EJO2543890.1 hypothetical protein [Salmonella enterica]ELF5187108.1 hypothetical protein [Salmonella enterica]